MSYFYFYLQFIYCRMIAHFIASESVVRLILHSDDNDDIYRIYAEAAHVNRQAEENTAIVERVKMRC
jgi:hypothetical protein